MGKRRRNIPDFSKHGEQAPSVAPLRYWVHLTDEAEPPDADGDDEFCPQLESQEGDLLPLDQIIR